MNDKDCRICALAKKTWLAFPTSLICDSKPFALVHVDVLGPFRSITFEYYRYFFMIDDDHTYHTWVYLMRTKVNTPILIRDFIISA